MKTFRAILPGKSTILRPGTFVLSPFFWLAVLLFFAAYCRLVNVTKVGIDGCDTFQYWHIATSWAKGNFVFGDPLKGDPRTFYRPLAYLIYGAVVKLFGHYDYSIRLLNVFANIVSIVLIFFIGKKVKSSWLGFLAAASYAFLPEVLYYCRTELLHILTGTFVLLSVLFFLNALKSNSSKNWFLYLILAGVSLSCGANVHPDTAYLAPGYVFFLFLYALIKKGFVSKLKNFLTNSLIFSMSFFSLYVIGGLFFGFLRIYKGLTGIRRETSTNSGFGVLIESFPANFARTLQKYIVTSVGTEVFFTILLICVGILLFILCYDFFRKRPFNKDTIPPILFTILVISYLLGSVLVTDKSTYRSTSHRLFIPMIPLVFIFAYDVICIALKKIPWKHCGIMTVAIISLYIVYNADIRLSIKRYKTAAPSVYREVYNVLGSKVDSQNKLLLLPCSLYYVVGFSTISYFGEDSVVYARNCREPLDDFIKRNDVRYIFYVTNGPLIRWRSADIKNIAASCYGVSPKINSPQREYEYFMRKIAKNRRKSVIYGSRNGMLFDVSSWYLSK